MSVLSWIAQTEWAYHLLGNHTTGLDGEFSTTHVKQVFERWSEKINHEDIV